MLRKPATRTPEAKYERVAYMNVVLHHLTELDKTMANNGRRADLLNQIWELSLQLDRNLRKDLPST